MRYVPAILAILVASGVFAPRHARAYPQMIRMGYVSCRACHTSAVGGGALTGYGLTIQGEMSAFVRQNPPTEESWMMHYLHSRVALVAPSSRSEYFLMQLDYLNTTRILPTLRIDGALGLGLERGGSGQYVQLSSGWGAIVLRRLFLTWDFARSKGFQHTLQVGRDLFPGGIGIDDHTAYLRTRTRRSVLDYATQIRYELITKPFQGLAYAFGPSFEEKRENQEYGGGLRTEVSPWNWMAVGVSGLYGRSPTIERWAVGPTLRIAPFKWGGVLAEYQWMNRAVVGSSVNFAQHVTYLKNFYYPLDWLELGGVAEYLQVQAPFGEQAWKVGPSLNARIVQWGSFLADLRHTWRSGVSQGWVFAGQIFIHW